MHAPPPPGLERVRVVTPWDDAKKTLKEAFDMSDADIAAAGALSDEDLAQAGPAPALFADCLLVVCRCTRTYPSPGILLPGSG